MLIPPQFLAVGAAAALLAGFAGGWTVRDWKADSAALAAAQAADKAREALQGTIDANATQYEQWRAAQEPARLETRNTIREIFRDKPIPVECAAPDALVGLLDRKAANASAAARGQPGPAVPDDRPAAAPAD